MKRMNFKSNGDLSVVSNDDVFNVKDFTANISIHGASTGTTAMFADMLNQMLSNDIVEVHIEQNNNALICHEVTKYGSVNACSVNDYPAFGCIDDWVSDFEERLLPHYVDPTDGDAE